MSPAREGRPVKPRQSRRKVKRGSAPPGILGGKLRRRIYWRIAALATGGLALLLHIYTFETPAPVRNLFAVSIRDLIYHSGMLLAFAGTYRVSLASISSGFPFAPELSTALVCCSWGAACELIQLLIPGREFHWVELGLNVSAPLVVALLSAAITWIKLSLRR